MWGGQEGDGYGCGHGLQFGDGIVVSRARSVFVGVILRNSFLFSGCQLKLQSTVLSDMGLTEELLHPWWRGTEHVNDTEFPFLPCPSLYLIRPLPINRDKQRLTAVGRDIMPAPRRISQNSSWVDGQER